MRVQLALLRSLLRVLHVGLMKLRPTLTLLVLISQIVPMMNNYCCKRAENFVVALDIPAEKMVYLLPVADNVCFTQSSPLRLELHGQKNQTLSGRAKVTAVSLTLALSIGKMGASKLEEHALSSAHGAAGDFMTQKKRQSVAAQISTHLAKNQEQN